MNAGILGEVERIIIETDEENPVSVAVISEQYVDVAEGYKVRVVPEKEDADEEENPYFQEGEYFDSVTHD